MIGLTALYPARSIDRTTLNGGGEPNYVGGM
jgi:hypothetical protein